ncbi:aminoglycoside phosphotransferase family protein [Actinoplanes sp. NPDC051411]|uniref:phosphotransferase enzyme family protein n=1 Tax=Actinoplanes sp. NPDC051411 TaxID=3155522 RepID=UPI00342A7F3F
MINDVEALPGGNMGGATRAGATVRRNAGPWSPTIQRLLGHLHDHGVDWVPSPLGFDERGRDSVSFLPGLVPNYPLPHWIWTDDVLADAGRRLAQLHRATATFDTTDAVWQLESRSPAEVVCHNDFAPYNMVFTDGRLTGVIDWDTASPGPRVWDLAYLAYRLVPLTEPQNVEAGPIDPHRRAGRLASLCDAYADGPRPADVLPVVVDRLHALANFTQSRADEGNEHLRSHVDLYRNDAAWIADNMTC